MTATFKLRPEELDESFLEKLRGLFARTREINVTISDSEMDETEFLMSDPNDYARLLASMKQIRNGEGLVEFDTKTYR
ncbi:MAG TPA: hypothetical protein VFH95_12545 [Candidatus Kapabacteria bacterium]|nr:hypothetical protein [Candidatus Kapabacteria bacterium]